MDATKVTLGLALSFLLVLLGIIVFSKNPEEEQYDNAIESMMNHHGLSSEEDVLAVCPELQEIRSELERIACLKKDIHALTAGPAPDVSEEDRLLLDTYKIEIAQLQKKVNQELNELKAAYAVAEH